MCNRRASTAHFSVGLIGGQKSRRQVIGELEERVAARRSDYKGAKAQNAQKNATCNGRPHRNMLASPHQPKIWQR